MTKQHDPIVEVSLTCLGRATKAIERGDKYNTDEITLADYFPNGIEDHVVKTREALLRLYALKENGESSCRLMQEAEDVLGHMSLGLAHVIMGLFKGKLSLKIENLGAGIHVGRREECVNDQTKSTEDAGSGADGSSECGSADQA